MTMVERLMATAWANRTVRAAEVHITFARGTGNPIKCLRLVGWIGLFPWPGTANGTSRWREHPPSGALVWYRPRRASGSSRKLGLK